MSTTQWTPEKIPQQNNRIVVITGSNNGLGLETAKELACHGNKIIMAVRNTNKGDAAKQSILEQTPDANIDVMALDLASLKSVRDFSAELANKVPHIDVLVNNAGLMFTDFARTEDNFELQMGTNYLGHFGLTAQLLPLLKKAESNESPRIVTLSSLAHRMGNISFDDINWTARKYKKQQAYYDSKLANMVFHNELTKRLADSSSNIIATAAHPGLSTTGLMQHSLFAKVMINLFGQAAELGALPSLMAVACTEAKNGSFYGPQSRSQYKGYPGEVECSKASLDAELGKQLWSVSEQLTDMKFEV